MMAYKCDRCGVYYVPYKPDPEFPLSRDGTAVVRLGAEGVADRNERRALDKGSKHLCPKCLESYRKWMNDGIEVW